MFKPTKAGIGTEWQPLVKQIVRVSRNVLHRSARTGLWTSTSEVAYYLANTEASASRFAAAIRSHWHVENKLHYTRDVTFPKTARASATTPASSPACAASLTTFYDAIRTIHSIRTDTPPHSVVSTQYSR